MTHDSEVLYSSLFQLLLLLQQFPITLGLVVR